MSEYTYTNATGKLKDLLEKIRTIGKPQKNIDTKWLNSIGFKNSDRPMLGILHQIGFTNDDNIPTERWTQYKGKDYKRVLAIGIKEGYNDLYNTYPDAHNRSKEDLVNFISSKKASVGEQAISAIVNTYKALCELADFSEGNKIEAEEIIDNKSHLQLPANESNKQSPVISPAFTPNLHINIQIHISADSSLDQIDQIFKSMAKHFKGLGNLSNE